MTSNESGIKSLVSALNQPVRTIKKIVILDTFIEIFNIKMYMDDSSPFATRFQENLLNNYVAMLLQSFNYCGIYEALIKVETTNENSELTMKVGKI
jgi:hypothetical protein